jgi:undecaprenyl-diphosphatase
MTDHVFEPALAKEASVPSDRRHSRLFAGGVACALAFVALAVFAYRVPLFPIDLTITRHVQGIHATWFGLLLLPFNMLGFEPFVGIIYGSTILLILVAGARWEAVASGFATLGAAGLNYLVKALVDRPRPPMDLIHVAHQLTSPGFPAGHVLNFTAFIGFLCYLTWVRLSPSLLRTALITLLMAMMALMGIARIDAGEHWPSDVLGGYLLGVVWMVTTVELYEWGRGRSRIRRLGRLTFRTDRSRRSSDPD